MNIDEFKQMDLRVAKILSAERVPESDKLIKLQIDLGGEQRQIIAGIGNAYETEELTGKEIVVMVNMEPRTLMGHESRGMLLAAHGENGAPVILTVEKEVPPGAKIT